ncbi:NAD(P)H-binding protein [Bombilactobacillus folatiphilus]|uniref:NAD(P)H-binding protein n=1 Tax=Bombilactobacillus folatiphilus TaxID=2923362 RepID=A0ABY4P6Z1_9LACO|nr:NAD(P)H-binding protein [Bombilactobacillus folatiphilus]UQS81484.1 NAD(P)H-binding protein [Bombilactobacillus folatiphilus]
MKIAVIGATGMAGAAVVKEAVIRGHLVTALSRTKANLDQLVIDVDNDRLTTQVMDAFELMAADLNQFDVVVDAFATDPQKAYLHLDLATKLIALLREVDRPRLVFILGAGSLLTGSDDHLFVRDMEQDPQAQAFIAVPQNQLAELDFLRNVNNVNWVGISPGINFLPGSKKALLMGENHLLYNEQQVSTTSSGTMAVAILDEIEQPKHFKQRFTVIDK